MPLQEHPRRPEQLAVDEVVLQSPAPPAVALEIHLAPDQAVGGGEQTWGSKKIGVTDRTLAAPVEHSNESSSCIQTRDYR
jgi:hypothetical protein